MPFAQTIEIETLTQPAAACGVALGDHAGGARSGRRRGGAAERVTPKHVAMRWAQRLKQVFAIEIERCRGCGGRLIVMASIEDSALIERILAHVRHRDEEELPLPLGARAPPPLLL